jgi:hypothetical protein
MTREEVLDRVRTAFVGVPAPADPADADDAALADMGIHRLGPEAVRYHFLRIVARVLAPDAMAAGDEELRESLIFLLRDIKEHHSRWQVSLFDAAQRAAVRDLLRFLKDNPADLHYESLKLVERAILLWEKLG